MEIKSTSNYAIFKTLNGNRPVNMKHVMKIISSMKKKMHHSPIQVNEKMEVIDGQHRLAARKALGAPVEYYISKGADLSTVQDLNTNTEDWKVNDYLHSYIQKGIKDYIIYKQFLDTYKFSHQVTTFLLTGAFRYDSESFANGSFKIKDVEKAADFASKLTELGKYYDGYKRRTFCYAFARCMNNPTFSFTELTAKLSYQRSKLYDCAKVEQYLELIEEIYNYKRSKSSKIILRNL
jgi:hypothetical protein